MSNNKQFTIELPAYWCSALINNDWYHYNWEIKDWQRANPNACITSCSDESYTGRYDGLTCDVLTYNGHYTA